MSLNYNTFVSQVANLLVISSADANFGTMLPGMIDYGEQRVYRELNLVNNQVRDTTGSLTPNSRTFSLPTSFGNFVVVNDVNVITPSSLTLTTGGTRNQLNPCAIQILDYLYPTETAPTTPSIPSLFAMIDQATIAVGPAPDAAYHVEVIGVIRPTPLSAANSSTFLASNLPDLFMAACMVFGSGYTRDFSAQGDNPQMGASWEVQYQKLLQSAVQEEVRKKYNSAYASQFMPQPTSGGAV